MNASYIKKPSDKDEKSHYSYLPESMICGTSSSTFEYMLLHIITFPASSLLKLWPVEYQLPSSGWLVEPTLSRLYVLSAGPHVSCSLCWQIRIGSKAQRCCQSPSKQSWCHSIEPSHGKNFGKDYSWFINICTSYWHYCVLDVLNHGYRQSILPEATNFRVNVCPHSVTAAEYIRSWFLQQISSLAPVKDSSF